MSSLFGVCFLLYVVIFHRSIFTKFKITISPANVILIIFFPIALTESNFQFL